MACGFGMSAVRALSRQIAVPSFMVSRSTPRAERTAEYAVPDAQDIAKQAAVQPSDPTKSTHATLDERYLEAVIYNDNEECDSDGCVVDDKSELEFKAPVRTQTMTSGDMMPDPSQFMDPKWVSTYTKLFIEEDVSKGVDSAFDSEQERADHFAAGAESDCEEMYTGPLQPKRTTARKDFPSPNEYLTKEELSLALKSYE
eukprot:TRINITY_DN14503_c0_g1_i1.p1 TRINITY_DN14503_c0_g1~~TRINITY_DN14503_c0_g1_i1.p1  ORF type:complete len:200 (+),score=50.51 TRINITY_DN14503_c0_g1_i1:96-695(+)